jgi:hypothetical protein
VKWLADENFNNNILRGILRHDQFFSILRAQDVPEVAGRSDVVLLAWATEFEHILLTHDLSTMLPAVRIQLARSSRCTPIVFVPKRLGMGEAIEEIILMDACFTATDWSAGIIYLPLTNPRPLTR